MTAVRMGECEASMRLRSRLRWHGAIPRKPLVAAIAHKTDPTGGAQVSQDDYFALVDMVVEAYTSVR